MNISQIGFNNTQRLSGESAGVRNQAADKPAMIDTSDKLQKSEDTGFFSGLKSFVRKNITGGSETKGCCNDFSPSGSFLKKSAVAGTVIGGVTGFAVGYATTETDVSKMPLQTANVEWKEPVMNPRYLGDIPRDHYAPVENASKPIGKEIASIFQKIGNNIQQNLDPQVPVHADAPVRNMDGSVMMADRHQIVTGRGELHVKWETKPIGDPVMKEYIDDPKFDTHKEVIGKTPDGSPVTRDVVDGVSHHFKPEIQFNKVGEYKVPTSAEFGAPNPWEKAGEGLAIGALAGLGIGTLVGLIHKVIAKP
ncbi:MAG: hypothetical protein LWY06_11555 [Firmicutes bacterium]|nr:hypothetical protein [Bacillota bacterium]